MKGRQVKGEELADKLCFDTTTQICLRYFFAGFTPPPPCVRILALDTCFGCRARNVAQAFLPVINEWRSYWSKTPSEQSEQNESEGTDRWPVLRALREKLPDMKDGEQRNREAIAELGGRTFAYMVAKGFCDKDGEASLSSLVAL